MYPGTDEVFETAARIFAGELASARRTKQGSTASASLLAPSGICVRRIFIVGALTEVEGSPGDAMHARIADPTGTFELEIGWQDRVCGEALAALPVPSFAAVTGICRVAPGRTDRPPVVLVEAVSGVNRAARDAWVKRTALATIERLETLAAALRGESADLLAAETVREYRHATADIADLVRMVLAALATVRDEARPAVAGHQARDAVLAILGGSKTPVPYVDLLAAGVEQGCAEDAVKQAIVALLEEGECYQPRAGLIKRA